MLEIIFTKVIKKYESGKRYNNMVYKKNSLINVLIEKGVKIPNPSSVEIGEGVDINLISSEDVTIHSGCKIFGKKTLIMSGVKLG
ncbi:unnamed protein product, partial [marine sediment metagenome]